jgi:YHS domain-containing protein
MIQISITTPICPTCGCSLVRLGIKKEEAVTFGYSGKDYNFCCNGCEKKFAEDPERYLSGINNIVVCPTCLAEKPIESTIKIKYDSNDIHFCRCPCCVEEFRKNPQYFINRLSGA